MSGVPTGGSTGLDHESTSAIDQAAEWLVGQETAPSPIVPALRERFGLTPADACQAIREATLRRARAAGARIFDSTKKAAESGEALRLRYAAQTATLTSIAQASAQGLEKALRYIAVMIGVNPEEVVVKPNLDFLDTSLTPQEAQALVAVWQAGGMSKRSLFENLQRGEIVSAERSFEEEEEEIEAEGPDLGLIGREDEVVV